MGSGGPRGLQILLSGGSPVRGGFDSHTFPPVPAAALLALALLSLASGPWAGAARAQGAPPDTLAAPRDTAAADSLAIPLRAAGAGADSALRPPPARPRRADEDTVGFFGSPTGIMLRSLVVPGWGQAANGAWVKAGIVAAAEGALAYSLIRDTRRLSELAPGSLEYEEVFNRRQQAVWWLGAAVFLSMVDAYVDAHLQSGGVDLGPEPKDDGLSLVARVRWP